MDASPEFPSVLSSDSSDVSAAIETAQALWRQGNAMESLRFLRRAAESAETDGDDMRALALARAAADLKELVRPSVVPAAPSRPIPSAPPPSRPVTAPPPSRPVTAPPPRSRSSVAPPPRSSRPAPSRPLSPAAEPIPPAPKLEPWSPPVEPLTRGSASPAAPSARPPPTEPAHADSKPTPASASSASGGAHPALRVSVEVLSKNAGTFVVRVLGDGDELPRGSAEALLVPLRLGVDLRKL